MWLLSNEGDFLGGKRIWLSPGTEHLFGRGKDHSGPNCYMFPEQKSFSRKHLVIKIREVEPDAVGRPDRKSEAVLEDLGSKFGTELNGEKFTGTEKVIPSRTQGKEVHIIKMGQCKDLWRLEWHPVNITVNAHKAKKRQAPMANSQEMQNLFESCDIKFTERYQPQHTTHVVASKRNTPKGLQGLVGGQWVVTSEWLDALERQLSRPEVAEGEEQRMSPLAEDFDANWPDEANFIPAVSQEPVQRPAELLKPNPDRESVFKGYTFVFTHQTHYTILGPVVEGGGGKALFYELDVDSMRPEDMVRYIKDKAGESGLGEFEDGSEGKGVVMVRPNDDDMEMARFCQTVDIILGQRSIRQSDFLDAIVMIDATGLRKPLEESLGEGSTPFATPREVQSEVPESSAPAPPPSTEPPPETRTEQPPARRRAYRRAVTTSRFKGFDTFDPSEQTSYPPPPPENDETNIPDSIPREPSPVESQFSAPSRQDSEVPTARGRKRPHQEDDIVESVEDRASKVDKLFPASAAMKRRRMELGLETSSAEGTPVSDETPKSSKKPSAKLPFESRKKKRNEDIEEINIKQLAKERMEKEEEQRKQDEEALREALEGMDIESIKNLAKVEVMEVKPRENQLSRANENTDCARWKAEWDGRKNFKKFRKRRPGSTNEEAPLRGRKVIVGLEEVKKTDTTILGDDWFDQPGAGRRGSHATVYSTGSRLLASTRDGESDEEEVSFRRRGARSSKSESQRSGPAKSISIRSRDDVEMQDVDPEEIAGEPRNERIAAIAKGAQERPRERVRSSFTSERSRGASQRHTPESGSQSQTVIGDSARPSTANSTASSRGKRPAMGPPSGAREPLSKRSNASSGRSATLQVEEEDSGDELRFRRRRK
ncbi:uncharacterized protein BKA78DRAFT_309589 [Phyllosticta capitalensis]|uniref:uncharacterized protein n=1 Tax=Phyllosticta capitalensis TaxID=121624 RepID=UPI00312F8AAF